MNHQYLSHNTLNTSGLYGLFMALVVSWMPHISHKRQRVASAWRALILNPVLVLLISVEPELMPKWPDLRSNEELNHQGFLSSVMILQQKIQFEPRLSPGLHRMKMYPCLFLALGCLPLCWCWLHDSYWNTLRREMHEWWSWICLFSQWDGQNSAT